VKNIEDRLQQFYL